MYTYLKIINFLTYKMKKNKNFQTIIICTCMYIDTRYVRSMMGIHTSLNVASSISWHAKWQNKYFYKLLLFVYRHKILVHGLFNDGYSYTSLNVASSINALKYHQFLDMQNDKKIFCPSYYYIHLYIDTRYVHSMMGIHTLI